MTDQAKGVFKAAAIQMRSGTDPERNIAVLRDMVRQAADQGADYVQTPEMTGVLARSRKDLLSVIGDQATCPVAAAASELAAHHQIYLHIGSTAIALGEGKVANRAFLFAPDGDLVATYDKIHMFDVDLDNGESWRESNTYRPGESAVTAALPFAKLGLAICYDLRFPDLFRREAVDGATVLSAPAAFTRQTGEAHWHVLIRARAIENGAFMIAAAQGGKHEDGRETYGHSLIVDPWGRILAEADNDEPGLILAEIDSAKSAEARGKIPNLQNSRPFDLTATAHASALAVMA
ncbi:MAG: amidohydrolase [Rhizobiaceae bacterium MnEN-MB40S]|nr:MAG: amidohydrolase [Rhizobiaceae bacterium MnEN-MB40S]